MPHLVRADVRGCWGDSRACHHPLHRLDQLSLRILQDAVHHEHLPGLKLVYALGPAGMYPSIPPQMHFSANTIYGLIMSLKARC